MFFAAWAIYNFVYAQFNFLIPLNLEGLYQAKGAVYFGFLTSLNGLIVIIGTPLLTKYTKKLPDTSKLIAGAGLGNPRSVHVYFYSRDYPYVLCFHDHFYLREIMSTLGTYPYMTRRVPASHRGRISSVANIFLGMASYYSQWCIGSLLEKESMVRVWTIIAGIGLAGIFLYFILREADKKRFPLLYKKS